MNRGKIQEVKKNFSEYLPSITLNDELKMFLPDTLIEERDKHIQLIHEVEGFGFKYLRESSEVNGECLAYFKA